MTAWTDINDHLEGAAAKRLRDRAGLPLRDAARLLSMSILRLSEYEAGTVPIPAELRARMERVYAGTHPEPQP